MNDLSRPQLRLIIFYEWSCGTPAAETVTKIGKVFGETTVIDRTVRNWFARFQSGEKCFEDKDRCERPTALNNELLRDAVKEMPDVTTRELETMLGCSHQTISNIFHDFHWDAKGMLYYELLPQERTVNATTYSNQLASLAIALREKRPRSSAVHLPHDNARPHVAKATQAKLQELNWNTVSHPPYSPDIAPSDYHHFRPLHLFLKEKRFAKYEDLKMAVFDFFDSQPAAFWKKNIDDLPERWLTVVTNDGQYIVD
uniref:HTH_48 domain-containing protein n=1 Tax=Caenorhabditis japonica TaxID=281687 RepID=A0A8R1DFN6_CAEJA